MVEVTAVIGVSKMADQNGYMSDVDNNNILNCDMCEQPPSKLSLIANDQNNCIHGKYFPSKLENYRNQPDDTGLYATATNQPNDFVNFEQNTNQMTTEKMSRTNLYIKGLPESFTDEKLWNLAPQRNQIKSVKAATDDDGKCRGYGFIDFLSEDSAKEAIRHIKETYPTFTIKFAKENEKDRTNLYVTNLPKSWTTKDSDQLKIVFERFGTIQSAFVMMERSTNRTTGVGFVRYTNEQDAQFALQSIKNEPIILPECTLPIEAKFADKHNPESRRRRYPISTVLNSNGYLGYPLTICNAANGATDPLNALFNIGLQSAQNGLSPAQLIQSSKQDSMNKIAQNLYPKLGPSGGGTPLPIPDFGLQCGTALSTDSQLNALAAVAATAILTANPTPNSAYLGTGVRSPHAPSNLLSANPLSAFGTGNFPSAEAAILDPSLLYRCSIYGTDIYRQAQQQQQQQHLLSAAMSSLTSNQTNSVYTPINPDLASYLNYANLLNHHQTANLNGTTMAANCVLQNGTPITPVLTNHLNGLLSGNALLTTMSQAHTAHISSDPQLTVFNSRSPNAIPQWILPNQVVKNGSIDSNGTNHSVFPQNAEL